MKKVIVSVIIIGLCSMFCEVSTGTENIPEFIRTPEDLTRWLASEFQYRLELPDKWQSPEETINLRKGDCEDFAILVSEVLSRQGISSDILILKFKGLKASHAICIWQEKDGTYSFTTNRKLCRTGALEVTSAVEKFYPDWEKIIYTDRTKKHLRVVKRT